MQVWKYKVQPNGVHGGMYAMEVHGVPETRRIRYVGLQDGEVCVWVEVDPTSQPTTMVLFSVGTGFGEVYPDVEYIGTVQRGPYVWHLYA